MVVCAVVICVTPFYIGPLALSELVSAKMMGKWRLKVVFGGGSVIHTLYIQCAIYI